MPFIHQCTFCLCLSLQAGVCLFSSMGWVLMVSVCITNLGGEQYPGDESYKLAQYMTLYFYAIPMLFGFGLLYVGAVKPSVMCLGIGFWVLTTFSIYWIIISAISLINNPPLTHSVCIDKRCPEIHWLFQSYWHKYSGDCLMKLDSLLSDDDYIIMDEGEKAVQMEAKQVYEHQMAQYANDTNWMFDDKLGDVGIAQGTDSLESPFNYSIDVDSKFNDSFENVSSISDPYLHLETISFESSITGCTTNWGFHLAVSIFGFIFWLSFMMYGLIGTVLLIGEIRKMISTGEIDQALQHLQNET